MAALVPIAWPPSKPVWSPPSPPVWSPPSPSVCPPSTPGWPPTVALAPVECLPPFLPYGLPGYSGLHELPAALPFVSAQPASPVIDLVPAPSSEGAQLAGLVLGVPAPPFAGTQQGAPALSFASAQSAFPAISLPPEHSFAGEQPPTTTITSTQQIQAKGEKSQQIEQPADISTKPAGKMPTRQVLAAVRLQAAARGLLARRRLQKMRLEMQEAALTAIDLGNWGRDLGK